MEEVIKILTDLHPEVNFRTAEGLIDNRVLDSFDVVSVVGELMDEFDIQIGAEEMIPENFNSATAIHNLVVRLSDE